MWFVCFLAAVGACTLLCLFVLAAYLSFADGIWCDEAEDAVRAADERKRFDRFRG